MVQFRPSPIALEPCADQKAAVLSLLIRLPNGALPYTPPGQSGMLPTLRILAVIDCTLTAFYLTGLAIASTLVSLGSYASRKSNVSEPRELPRSVPKAKTPPSLPQIP